MVWYGDFKLFIFIFLCNHWLDGSLYYCSLFIRCVKVFLAPEEREGEGKICLWFLLMIGLPCSSIWSIWSGVCILRSSVQIICMCKFCLKKTTADNHVIVNHLTEILPVLPAKLIYLILTSTIFFVILPRLISFRVCESVFWNIQLVISFPFALRFFLNCSLSEFICYS